MNVTTVITAAIVITATTVIVVVGIDTMTSIRTLQMVAIKLANVGMNFPGMAQIVHILARHGLPGTHAKMRILHDLSRWANGTLRLRVGLCLVHAAAILRVRLLPNHTLVGRDFALGTGQAQLLTRLPVLTAIQQGIQCRHGLARRTNVASWVARMTVRRLGSALWIGVAGGYICATSD